MKKKYNTNRHIFLNNTQSKLLFNTHLARYILNRTDLKQIKIINNNPVVCVFNPIRLQLQLDYTIPTTYLTPNFTQLY